MYQVQQFVDGRWYPIGCPFHTRYSTNPHCESAASKVASYMLQGQQYGKPGTPRKLPRFRIATVK